MSFSCVKYLLHVLLNMLLINFSEQSQEDESRNEGNNLQSLSDLRFPSIYHATGKIRIPSAEIVEPFEAWYAGKYNKSRIDYYDGTVRTYQRADIGKYGTLFEVFPKYDYRHDNHYRGCWKKKGKKRRKVEPQGVLPKNVYWPFKMSIDQYKYMGKQLVNRTSCTKWIANITVLNRTDTYTFYATDESKPKPVKFEMQGYDVLLVSYYDHYIIDYTGFEEWNYDEKMFNTQESIARRDRWCQYVPRTTGEAGYRSLNPMGELLDDESYENFESKFQKYKRKFKKIYDSEEEYRRKMHIARHNMRYIHSKNRQCLGYKLNVNHFTDLSDDEYDSHRGMSYDNQEESDDFERTIPELTGNEEHSVIDDYINMQNGKFQNVVEGFTLNMAKEAMNANRATIDDVGSTSKQGNEILLSQSNQTYIPEQINRETKTFVTDVISNGDRRSFNTKHDLQEESFDENWTRPDVSEVKPFFMFGLDESSFDDESNDFDTYEEDFALNDESMFPADFRNWDRGKQDMKNWQTNIDLMVKRKKENLGKKGDERIPKRLDWREYGAVAPVQSQGICGSCWTFSTTAAVESAHFIKTGKLIKLSEQQLLDCTWYVPHSKDGNHGCMGGWTWKSFAYIKKFGLAASESYGKYFGIERSCNTKNLTITTSIDSFMKVKANNARALKKALATYGPATASINTEAKTLKFYSKGVYSDRECTGNTDHSVLIVGYGEENGKLYWIVKNSWGTAWGENGYVRIQNGRCGLLKKPWVVINRHRKPLPWLEDID